MTNFQRRHQAATGAKAGQYVPCTAELQCTLSNASHVSGIVFEATKQWLGRDGIRITNADVSPEEVARFRRSDDYLEYVDRADEQKREQAAQNPASVKELPKRSLVAVGSLRKGDVVVFSDGDGYTSPKRVESVQNNDGYNVRVRYVDDANPNGMELSTTIWHTTPINRLEKPASAKKVSAMDEFYGGSVPAARKVKSEAPAPKRTTHEELSEMMDLGRVIQVAPNGAFPALNGLGLSKAPEEIQYVDLDADGSAGEPDAPKGWEYLKGFTNQYGYHGAIMHESEVMAGGIAEHILDNPGFYAAVEIGGMYAFETDDGESWEPVGWGVLHYVGESE